MMMLLFCLLLSLLQESTQTALDDYVNRYDDHYSWQLLATHVNDDSTTYILNVTSQKWKNESYTDYPIWFHHLIVTVPNTIQTPTHAFMMIGNGQIDSTIPIPGQDNRINDTITWAEGMGAVVGYVKQIPNQSLHCAGDPPGKVRREDDLISWTWRRYMDDPSDPEILLRLPMVKGVVKSMDAMAEFVPTVAPPGVQPQEFLVAGGSKRGWTAYLVGAVDPRVFAMAPSVLTCLNFVENVHHQYQSLGGWSFAQIDYYRENLTQQIEHPNLQSMMDIVDPYAYIDRMSMPKLIISGVGDEHFLPDDTYYFWDDLVGDKYYWMIENSGHSLGYGANRTREYITFFRSIVFGSSLPKLSWTRNQTDSSGYIHVTTDITPSYVGMIWGTTLDGVPRRDFRRHILDTDGITVIDQIITWNEEPVMEMSPGEYRAEMNKPANGFLLFYIKLEYDIPNAGKFYTTTEVNILPDVMPFERCQGTGCYGPLV